MACLFISFWLGFVSLVINALAIQLGYSVEIWEFVLSAGILLIALLIFITKILPTIGPGFSLLLARFLKEQTVFTITMEPTHLLCGICHDIYKDPRSLDCGHSFCKECLWLTWDTRRRGTKYTNFSIDSLLDPNRNRNQDINRIDCAMCRRNVLYRDFPINYGLKGRFLAN